ncbi:PREDICTED: equilibrative nucleotide transporter 8-like [Populus euphratica]|uniref:Equilibrative nucleotide transporter 8-like n=1 Tax=Populus euphratica TaxID=75702 RepID=A0AAJ6TWG0_POPEU|nr:PREDICTED: equilibrative nucleotide transporter 8-like [Populus euphratica]
MASGVWSKRLRIPYFVPCGVPGLHSEHPLTSEDQIKLRMIINRGPTHTEWTYLSLQGTTPDRTSLAQVKVIQNKKSFPAIACFHLFHHCQQVLSRHNITSGKIFVEHQEKDAKYMFVVLLELYFACKMQRAQRIILISILRIITKASLPQNPQRLRTSAHFYLIVTAIILLCWALSSNLLYKLPDMEQNYKLAPDDSLFPKPKFLAVARKVRWPAFGVLMIFIVTLSLFPGFIAEDISSKLLKDKYPVLLITIYNVADFAGKSLTTIYVLQSIKKATWGCILRLVFYPLFAACLNGPKWLETEVPVAILTFMLGVTNGYLTSVLMILAPMAVSVSEAELSAIAMVVFLGIGLVGGSVIGWFWIIYAFFGLSG